ARLIAWHGGSILLQRTQVTAGLASLELDEILDESIAQRVAEQRLSIERMQRLGQAFWQQWTFGRVRLVTWRWQRGIVFDAGQPGDDLRKNIEVRISRWLADAVFQPRCRIPWSAE